MPITVICLPFKSETVCECTKGIELRIWWCKILLRFKGLLRPLQLKLVKRISCPVAVGIDLMEHCTLIKDLLLLCCLHFFCTIFACQISKVSVTYIHKFSRKLVLCQNYSVKYTKRKIPIPQMATKAKFRIIFILGDS